MGKLDTAKISARMNDINSMIKDASFYEDIESKGITPEGVIKEAKEALKLKDEQSILVDSAELVKSMNAVVSAFRDANNLASRIEETGVASKEQVDNIRGLEAELAQEAASRLGIEVKQLYL